MTRLWSAEDLSQYDFRFPFLIEPVVPRGGIVFLHGKRAIGKTHLCLTLSACLSEGGKLFGKYPTEKSTILYIQADTPEPVQAERVRIAIRNYPMERVFFTFPQYLNIMTMHRDKELIDKLHEKCNPDFVIWDTLRKIHKSSSNDDDVPSQVYGAAKSVFPKATQLFVHHDKKTVVDQEELDKEEFFRGSGAWLDDADTGIHLQEGGKGRLVLTFTKVRTCDEQDPITLLLNKDDLVVYAPGQAMDLVEHWKLRNPQGVPEDLYRYLLASFACSPQMAHRLAFTNGRRPES